MNTAHTHCTCDRLPLILIVLTLAVYLPGFTWGIPHATGADRTHAWGNDDQVPLAPLAEMHNTFVVAKPDRNIAYPWFHYGLLAAAYSPYLVYLYFTGEITSPTGVYPFGLNDPVTAFRHLSWIGRLVSHALAIAVVLGMYYAGKHLWGRLAGFLAAVFTMLLFPMAYYAKLGNPDVPVLGWTCLGLAFCALIIREGLTSKRAAWLGAFMAIAAATKDQSAGSFILLAPPLLVMHLFSGRPDRTLLQYKNTWSPIVANLLSFAVVYAIASGIPVDPTRFAQHVSKTLMAGTTTKLYSISRHPATLAGYAHQAFDIFAYMIDVMGWPLLIMSFVGVALATVRDRKPLIILLASLGFFLILLPVRFTRVHYSLPIAVPFTLFAAYAACVGLQHRLKPIRAVTLIAIVCAVGGLLLNTLSLNHDMRHDARYAAADWLDQHTLPGDRLIYFGGGLQVPPLREDVGTIPIYYRDEARPALVEQRPEFVLVMPLDFNEDRQRVEWRRGPHSVRSDYLPPDVFDDLADGSLGYRLVAQFQSPPLFTWWDRPFLTYATVNPPIQIFVRDDRAGDAPRLDPWRTAPYNPRHIRIRERTVDWIQENPLPQS